MSDVLRHLGSINLTSLSILSRHIIADEKENIKVIHRFGIDAYVTKKKFFIYI